MLGLLFQSGRKLFAEPGAPTTVPCKGEQTNRSSPSPKSIDGLRTQEESVGWFDHCCGGRGCFHGDRPSRCPGLRWKSPAGGRRGPNTNWPGGGCR
ncbi:hypothetical protein OJAV_G00023330 [Oryzias javanicus]|uniref:Uncharacterized protein n=1 Tax=Oryzias javanicus TaxID=123683 RepID=A0A3S2PIN3_ORYJA|nr:hypothetical protein OJAV_G00023330 [Oryzias javanicus]